MIRVLMLPRLSSFDTEESGIKRVVEAYHRYASAQDIVFVDCNVADTALYDVCVVHAGTSNRYPIGRPIVAMLHGLYWTADYHGSTWEMRANASVIESVRRATVITVPSDWVAETIARDFRVRPIVVHHGIDVGAWENKEGHGGYVLWNKNRFGDVCDPIAVTELARRFPNVRFITTFATSDRPKNVEVTGVLPHDDMAKLVKKAMVYLSTTKETFGIGILEALAAGVPVLGFKHGGNAMLVGHGVSGYLARPNDYAGLARGLEYVMKHREILSKNAAVTAKRYRWEDSLIKLREALDLALAKWEYDKTPIKIDKSLYEVGE